MTDTTMVYVGREACGCIVAVQVDDAETDRIRMGRRVSKWIRNGLAVSRISIEAFRAEGMCRHKRGQHPEAVQP